MQLTQRQGNEVREKKKTTRDGGLTTRLILSMATDMAAAKRSTERACIMFEALAKSVGVNVTHAFEAASE
jgi:hypothetical protein